MDRINFKEVIDKSDYGFAVADMEGKIVYLNECFARMHGYEIEEVQGQHLSVFHNREQMEAVINELDRLKENEVPVSGEVWHVRKDGSVFPTFMKISLLKDESGKPILMLGVAMDITSYKKSEQELRESEEKYRLLVENQFDLVVKVDLEGRFLFVSPSYCEMFGKTEEELLGKSFTPLVDEDDRKKTARARESLHNPPYYYYLEQRAVTKYGWRWLGWAHKSVLDKGNKVVAIVSVGRDISRQKENEEKIRAYQEQLRSMAVEISLLEDKQRQKIAEGLHDHVGQLLALSKIKLDVLKNKIVSEDKRRIVEEILDLVEQTIGHIRLLTAEIYPPVLHQLGLEATMKWLVDKMKDQYGLDVNLTINELDKYVDENIGRFSYKSVSELLLNVAKHARTPHAEVKVLRKGKKLLISVEDHGVGFKIGEEAGDSGLTGGFGLFSIKERADYFGGNFKVSSGIGQGTSVNISLPLKTGKKIYGVRKK